MQSLAQLAEEDLDKFPPQIGDLLAAAGPSQLVAAETVIVADGVDQLEKLVEHVLDPGVVQPEELFQWRQPHLPGNGVEMGQPGRGAFRLALRLIGGGQRGAAVDAAVGAGDMAGLGAAVAQDALRGAGEEGGRQWAAARGDAIQHQAAIRRRHAPHDRPQDAQPLVLVGGQAAIPQPAGGPKAQGQIADALAGLAQRAGLFDRGVHQRLLRLDAHPHAQPGDAAKARVIGQIVRPAGGELVRVGQPGPAVVGQADGAFDGVVQVIDVFDHLLQGQQDRGRQAPAAR